MNYEEFQLKLTEVLFIVRTKLTAKGQEYGREDRLHNFKKGAERRKITPELVLLGMQEKHSISIDDMINDTAAGQIFPLSVWEEKITDRIAYDICLLALVSERLTEDYPTVEETPSWTIVKEGTQKFSTPTRESGRKRKR